MTWSSHRDGFVADVRLLGSDPQIRLNKRYAIKGPPITGSTRLALETRAYQMVTALFLSMVSDPQFQAVVAQ